MRVETVQVPVDRLVENLEKELKTNPGNVQTILNLARLHAMAFANKQETFPATTQKDGQPELPSYTPGSSQLPRTVAPASSESAASATQHLKEATRHYEAALALAPDNLTARIGHGWVLEQAGDKKAAIAEYRKVIEQAWPSEQKIKTLMPSQRVFTQEAAGYLIPLLDTERDAAEIADLRGKQSDIAGRPRAITPVVVPLTDDEDVSDLVDPLARVRFDADGTLPREWTWITPKAGWLVYDAHDRGTIASALQLFGNVTFWLFWSNGYEPMRALDDNGDGELSGAELQHISIWHDRDGDAVSNRREVQPLSAYGIVALSYDHVAGDGRRVVAYAPRGVRFSNGRTRPTYDVILRHATTAWTRR
jgi:tetratricopeptide (TPR) repeat protein